MITIYTDRCLTCKYKTEVKVVKAFARSIGSQVQIKKTRYNHVIEAEAKQLTDVPMPYVYNDETKCAVALIGIDDVRVAHLL